MCLLFFIVYCLSLFSSSVVVVVDFLCYFVCLLFFIVCCLSIFSSSVVVVVDFLCYFVCLLFFIVCENILSRSLNPAQNIS